MNLRSILEVVSTFDGSIYEAHELLYINGIQLKLYKVAKGGFNDFEHYHDKDRIKDKNEFNIESVILKNESLEQLQLLHTLFLEELNRINKYLYNYLNKLIFPLEFNLIDLSTEIDDEDASLLTGWIEHLQTTLFVYDNIMESIHSHRNGEFETDIRLKFIDKRSITFKSKDFIPTLNDLVANLFEITKSARKQNFIYLKCLAEINYLEFGSLVEQISGMKSRSIIDEFLADKRYNNDHTRKVLKCYLELENKDISTAKFIEIITRTDTNSKQYRNFPYLEDELLVSPRTVHSWIEAFKIFLSGKIL